MSRCGLVVRRHVAIAWTATTLLVGCSLVRSPDDLGAGSTPVPDASPDILVPAPDAGDAGNASDADASRPSTPAPENFRATTDRGSDVRLSWSPPLGRAPTRYELSGGNLTSTVSLTETSYEDTAASPGSLAVALRASDDRVDAVALTITMTSTPGRSHGYGLVAVYPDGQSETTRAEGARRAPSATGGRVRVDSGSWSPLGSLSTHLDTAARPSSFAATATASPQVSRGIITLTAAITPVLAEHEYEVVIDTDIGSFSSTAAKGARAPGTPRSQWYRGPASGTRVALSGATGTTWFDPTPPVDTKLDYQLEISGDNVGATSSTVATAELPSVIQASSAWNHTCVLQKGGTIACFGGTAGPATDPPTGTGHLLVRTGAGHACAIRSSGTVTCWGDNLEGQAPADVAGSFSDLALGQEYSCGLQTGGKRVCWGYNYKGQAPPAESAETFTAVAGSWLTTCGILTGSGTPHCIGYDGDRIVSTTPSSTPLTSLSVATKHACALSAQGMATCWGDTSESSVPPTPRGPFLALAAAGRATFAIRESGTLAYYSASSSGMPSPRARVSTESLASITAGHDPGGAEPTVFGCAITVDGLLRCFGDNQFGQAPPTPLYNRVLSIAAGPFSSCAALEGGSVDCFGSSPYRIATGVPSQSDFTRVGSGEQVACGLRQDGSSVCWGSQSSKTGTSRKGPFVSLAVGYGHVCYVRADDQLVECQGLNANGEATPPAGLGPTAQLSVYDNTTCARLATGALRCWGRDRDGNASPPATPTSWNAIGVGATHSCGVAGDTTLVCWGSNTDGQCNAPTGGGFVEVASGGAHSCARRSDGTITCWGANNFGQATAPATRDRWKALALGQAYSCGIRDDDHMVCWGDNSYGQAPRP